MLPLDAFVLVIKFDQKESKGFFGAAKQFVRYFGRIGIKSLMIICIQANDALILSTAEFRDVLLKTDGYTYLFKKNSNISIPFCLWDNLSNGSSSIQEENFVTCLQKLEPFGKINFEYTCDMLQNDIEKLALNCNNGFESFKSWLSDSWLSDSLILNKDELITLFLFLAKFKNGALLYRATRDGFTAAAFHQKCDGKVNTITIIRNNANYVFGGYASAAWHSAGTINDANAFLFSLRRNGNSENHKFMIKSANTGNAMYWKSTYGPTFGYGHDIHICNNSNTTTGSYSNIGHSYEPPQGVTYNTDSAKSFLAGSYGDWTTTEIEVYQIS